MNWRTQWSKITVRTKVVAPTPRAYFAVSKWMLATISTAFGSRSTGWRRAVSRARAASGMNRVSWTAPSSG